MKLARDKLLIYGLTDEEIAQSRKEPDGESEPASRSALPSMGRSSQWAPGSGNSYDRKDVLIRIRANPAHDGLQALIRVIDRKAPTIAAVIDRGASAVLAPLDDRRVVRAYRIPRPARWPTSARPRGPCWSTRPGKPFDLRLARGQGRGRVVRLHDVHRRLPGDDPGDGPACRNALKEAETLGDVGRVRLDHARPEIATRPRCCAGTRRLFRADDPAWHFLTGPPDEVAIGHRRLGDVGQGAARAAPSTTPRGSSSSIPAATSARSTTSSSSRPQAVSARRPRADLLGESTRTQRRRNIRR